MNPYQSYNEAVWTQLRPIITQLYLAQNLKLEDVRKEMEARFGFKASRKMYNIRIARWKIKKNILATEKQELIDTITSASSNTVQQTLTLNSRAFNRLDKIERYLKMQSRSSANRSVLESSPQTSITTEEDESEAIETPSSPENHITLATNHRDQEFHSWLHSLLPKTSRSATLGPCRNESALRLWYQGMQIWIVTSPTSDLIPCMDEQSHRVSNQWYMDVIFTFLHARRSLELGSVSDARISLDKFCGDVIGILKTQYWPFINQFVAETVSPLWNGTMEWRTYIYSFLARMTVVVLGKEHHVTQLFRLLMDADEIDSLSGSMMRLGIDVLEHDQATYIAHAYEFIRDGINVLMLAGDVDSAKICALQHIVKAQGLFGDEHWYTHRALRSLAFIYKRNDELEESRKILLQILHNNETEIDQHCGSPVETSTDILVFLGDVCGRLRLYDESTMHLYRFLQITPDLADGIPGEWSCRALCLLKETLSREDKIEQMQSLPLLPDTQAAKRARAWANVRLRFWPDHDKHGQSRSRTGDKKHWY